MCLFVNNTQNTERLYGTRSCRCTALFNQGVLRFDGMKTKIEKLEAISVVESLQHPQDGQLYTHALFLFNFGTPSPHAVQEKFHVRALHCQSLSWGQNAENRDFGDPMPTPIADRGHIWHATVVPWCTIPCQIFTLIGMYTDIYAHI